MHLNALSVKCPFGQVSIRASVLDPRHSVQTETPTIKNVFIFSFVLRYLKNKGVFIDLQRIIKISI